MAKRKNRNGLQVETDQGRANDGADASAVTDGPQPRMKRKEYEREMRRLHGELVAMQQWVKATGARICIAFEGRDTAGKGGTIKRITERVSPRTFKVVALLRPDGARASRRCTSSDICSTSRPAGEVVIFDRSWYNRAGVEPVMGFCTPEVSARVPRAGAGRRAGNG